MKTIYKIKQQVKTVPKNWLETIWETTCLRAAQMTYDDYVAQHPDEYFELVEEKSSSHLIAFHPGAEWLKNNPAQEPQGGSDESN